MKTAHYLLAAACLAVGILIGINMQKSPALVGAPPGTSPINGIEMQEGVNDWYEALDMVPAYFVLEGENISAAQQVIQYLEAQPKIVMSLGSYAGQTMFYMAAYNDANEFLEGFYLNTPVIGCPTICDLHIIERPRSIEPVSASVDEDTPPQDEDPTPEKPREDEKPKK